jgi:hypothetical protein
MTGPTDEAAFDRICDFIIDATKSGRCVAGRRQKDQLYLGSADPQQESRG